MRPDRWRSVIAEGTFEEIDDPRQRDAALEVIYGTDGHPGPRVTDGRLPHSIDVALWPLRDTRLTEPLS